MNSKIVLQRAHGHAGVLALMLCSALVLTACTGDVLPAGGTDDTTATDTAPDTTVADAADAVQGTDTTSPPDTVDDTADVGSDGTDQVDTVDPTDTVDTAQPDVPADTGPGKCSADQIKACDDKIMCTTDKCTMPGGVCAWSLSDGWCFINGQCVGAGETKPGAPCFVCDPTVNSKAWSPLADGKPCDDGDLCTYDGTCQAQLCISKPTPCGDDNPCTTDTCDKVAGCLYPNVAAGTTCNDGNACTQSDTCSDGACAGKAIVCNDNNPCTDDACDMATGCTFTNHEGDCTDGDECTAGDACVGGKCQKGAPRNCDDGNTCTFDQCYPNVAGGCYHLAKQSPCCTGLTSVCDDANPCTSDDCDPNTSACIYTNNSAACNDSNACSNSDICSNGACAGSSITCDDNNACTSDSCDNAKGCVFVLLAASQCEDGNPCTDDACNPVGGCSHTNNAVACEDGDNCTVNDACKDGACASGTARNCDDGNTCSVDKCIPNIAGGCYHLATNSPCCTGQTSICDDGNSCTNDDCDPATSACLHSNNTAPCNDGTACTTNDACAGGACNGTTLNCDDGNPCTTDNCDPKAGCAHGNVDGGTCDDGSPCTTGDVCSAGKCVGQGQCTCQMTFSNQSSKFTTIAIGDGGKPGEGLDVDANPATCAPSNNCTSGINNSLGALAALANKPLQDSVTKGSVDFVLEYRDLKQGAITLGLYTAKVADTNPTCDFETQTCDYNVATSLIDYTKCLPIVALPGKLAGNLIIAGGKGTNFPFSLPIQNGVTLNIVIYGAQLNGTVQTDANGKITSFDGILGGAVPKAALAAAIDALPDGSLPLPKDSLKSILDSTVEADIDSNGDGTLDAASIGLKLHGIQAKIVGTY